MLSLPGLRLSGPVLVHGRVLLRPPAYSDHGPWAALRAESRTFLAPWEPEWPPDDLARHAWKDRMRRYRADVAQGTGLPFFIFIDGGNELAGGINIGHIRWGVSQSGQIGYWMGARHAGQGLMLDALNALLPHAFGPLGLHRLEAACIPDNKRSISVLEKAGFQREGLLRSYLKIAGQWRDHFLYARIGDGAKTNGA